MQSVVCLSNARITYFRDGIQSRTQEAYRTKSAMGMAMGDEGNWHPRTYGTNIYKINNVRRMLRGAVCGTWSCQTNARRMNTFLCARNEFNQNSRSARNGVLADKRGGNATIIVYVIYTMKNICAFCWAYSASWSGV